MQIFRNPNYDFVRWRWHAIALSWLVVLAGLGVVWLKGLPLGIDFSGGTIVIVQFEGEPEVQQIRSALGGTFAGGGQNVVVQRYGDPSQREVLIRVPQVGAESGGALSQTAEAAVEALKRANVGNFTVVGTEIVGPIVGAELTRRGILATSLALAGILVYVAIRFRFSFAVGAVVATVHDLLITLAFLAFFRYDLTLNVIAAILAITGYSVNDTIVIFDRVRENLRSMRRDTIDRVINVAVNQTLGRTVLTAGTTLLSVAALYVFGGEVLRGFAFTMLVGVITGTYSTVFIAAAIVSLWRKPVLGRAAAPAAPGARPRAKAQGKARAS